MLDLESSRVDGSFTVVRIGRSREVMQSYFTAVLSTLRALMHSFAVVWKERFVPILHVLLDESSSSCTSF